MAEFIDVMNQRNRMCEVYTVEKCAVKCPIGKHINPSTAFCTSECRYFLVHNPQKAEEIIMEWAKENPVKTNADKFMKNIWEEATALNSLPFTEVLEIIDDASANGFEFKVEDGKLYFMEGIV